MDIEKILQITHTKNIELNDKIFDIVLQEFLNRINTNINFNNCSTPTDKVLTLKEQYIYTSNYVKLFFEIIQKYNYNTKQEIKDAIFNLCHLKNPNKNKDIIKELLNSPIIDDISFNGKNEFVISSEQYGKFVVELASYYFKNNKKMSKYMKNNQLPNKCHNHAYFMSEVFNNFYAITSLCRYYFKGNYYHSYTYDKEKNSIIDLCYNSIIDKESYYKIFEPKDISVILNSNVSKELELTNKKTDQYPFRCPLMKIALYKQYLNSIGFDGILEDAPPVKVKKIDN